MPPVSKVNLPLTFTVLALLVLSMVPLPVATTGEPITEVGWFGDSSTSKDIQFNGPGTDTDTVTFSFQKGVTVQDASFQVDGLELTGEHPSNITIDVGGDGVPEWRFAEEGFGSFGHQELFLVDGEQNRSANLTITKDTGENTSAVIRLPYGAHVDSAELELEVKGVTIAIECKSNSASCSSPNNDPAFSLQSLYEDEGWTVTIVDGTEINTVEKLADYTVVVLGSSGYSADDDHDTIQTTLKNWVQNSGGGVVAMGWIVYATTSGSDMDDLLPVSPPYTWSSGQVTITNPNHPITQGVNNFNTPVSAHCEYPNSGSADNGATVLGTCSGPTIVYWDYGNGRSVYLGPNYFADFQGYGSAAWYQDANAVRLVKQATLWASGGGSLSGFIDLGDDGSKEWDEQDFNGSEVITGLETSLNNYLATAPATDTDEYGNTYVDIPITVNSTSAGLISMYNLSIKYTHTATVDLNPYNVSLTNQLNDLIPDDISPDNHTIPVHVSSDTTGLITLHSFHTDLVDPVHPPILTLLEPSDDRLDIDENETIDFLVEAIDWYRYPVDFTWYLDGEENTTGADYPYYADFKSMGVHNITVVADNGLAQASHTWEVKVQNVNRPPYFISHDPELETSVDENTTTTFTAEAVDPDPGEPVGYSWKLDGNILGVNKDSYDYGPGFKDQGSHQIEVTARDPRGLKVSLTWDIEVLNVNAPPHIYSFSPRVDPTMEENSSMNFMVKTNSPDGDPLSYEWALDDVPIEDSDQSAYQLLTDFEDAGVHELRVEVTDGVDTVGHTWMVTVTDVNRAPRAVIASPDEDLEYLNIDNITLSGEGSDDPDGDDLLYEWYDGTTRIGEGKDLVVQFTKGVHNIKLIVDDGREGTHMTTVSILVRKLDFDASIETDMTDSKEGDVILFKVMIDNIGDGWGEDVVVRYLIDGEVVGNETIESSGPGDIHNLEFEWTAVEGDHIASVEVGKRTAELELEVGPAPLINTHVGGLDLGWLLALILIIVICSVVVAIVVARRRKQKQRAIEAEVTPGPAEPAPAAAVPVGPTSPTYPEAQPVTTPAPQPPGPTLVPPPLAHAQTPARLPPPPPPGYHAQTSHVPMARAVASPPPPPPPRPLPPPPPLTSSPPYQGPGAAADDGFEAQYARIETMVQEAEASKDMRRARNFLRLAKTFQTKGAQEKAQQYLAKAENAINE